MTPNIVTQTINQLSYSSISEFLNCPKSWYSRRILGRSQKKTEAAGFGSLFDKGVAHKLGLGEDPFTEMEATDPTLQGVVEALDIYFKHPLSWKSATEAQKEIRIEPSQWGTLVDEYGGYGDLHVPFVGYLDLFKAEGLNRTVCDLKTADRTGMKPGWMLQTALYALATRARKIEIHLLVRTKTPKLVVYEYRPNEETFRWALTSVGYAAQQIRDAERGGPIDRFPALPGFWCGWCTEESCEGRIFNSMTEVTA